MVGPNFRSPPAPLTCNYIQNQPIKKTVAAPGAAGRTQYFQLGRDLPSEWWRVFHSKGINALIIAGISHSPNLAAAESALVEAQQNYRAQVGTLFPTITANFRAERERFSNS